MKSSVNKVRVLVLIMKILVKKFVHRWPRGASAVGGRQSIGLDECSIWYINLDSRPDRAQQIEKQLDGLSLIYRRFSAISHPIGAVGCALSHAAVLGQEKLSQRPVLIFEDDCDLIVNRDTLDQLVRNFLANDFYDVLCLGNNVRKGRKLSITRDFAVTVDTQTTSCYLIKPHMIERLQRVANRSVDEMLNGAAAKKSAIDIVWKELQRDWIFVVPRKTYVLQRPGYSDVEKTYVNYGR